jgi:hypothetical protein
MDALALFRLVAVLITGSRKTDRGESCLHSRGAVAQQIKILHRASSVADLQLDTVACKYSSVLSREVVVP